MKILYGVQATGNGHISRSRVMAQELANQGIEVTFLFSGREPEKLFDMQVFGDYMYRKGLTFTVEEGQVRYFKTWWNNSLTQFFHDVRTLDVSQYDLIITDFEPVTAWAGKLNNKRVLGLGHQYAFGSQTPRAGSNLLAETILKYFAPADIPMGLHWHRFANNILPPIIDTTLSSTAANRCNNHETIYKQSPEDEPFYLVYLPFEDQKWVTQQLNQLPEYQFRQYSSELSNQTSRNVALRTACYHGFKEDLKQASGVICNTGFELISECLHLGLPILTRPLAGQIEQLSNAEALNRLDVANTTTNINSQIIGAWLREHALKQPKQSGNFNGNKRARHHMLWPNVAYEVVHWLQEGDWDKAEHLSNRLWQRYQDAQYTDQAAHKTVTNDTVQPFHQSNNSFSIKRVI